MDFEEIEELNEEDMNVLYNDIVEFGDETKITDCCCRAVNVSIEANMTKTDCRSRCVGHSGCKGWGTSSSGTARYWHCPFNC